MHLIKTSIGSNINAWNRSMHIYLLRGSFFTTASSTISLVQVRFDNFPWSFSLSYHCERCTQRQLDTIQWHGWNCAYICCDSRQRLLTRAKFSVCWCLTCDCSRLQALQASPTGGCYSRGRCENQSWITQSKHYNVTRGNHRNNSLKFHLSPLIV